MRYVFDIDGTILNTDYIGCNKNVLFSEKYIDKINKLYDKGEIIILHTGRHWDYLERTILDLKTIGIKYHTLVMGKPPADVVIDDKAMRPAEFFNESLK